MKYKLQELIDIERINVLLELFNKTTGFVTSFIDLEGNVLSKSGWRQICTDFHRVNPETAKRCTESDTSLAGQLKSGEKYNAYKCLNGLVDVAVPIIINNEHVGNLFTGQFFTEKPDLEFFRKQARNFGFDEESYLIALNKVPLVSMEQAKTAMDFLLNMTLLFVDVMLQKYEVRKSEMLYHDLVETAQDLIWQCDAEGRYIYLNPAWEEVFGYKVEEMLGKKFTDFQTKEWAERDSKEFARLLKYDTIKGLETVHLAKDGSEIKLIFNAKVVKDQNGQVLGTRGTAFNISSIRKIENALRKIESNYSSLFNSMNEGVVLHQMVYDDNNNAVDYRIVETNPAFALHTGMQFEKGKNQLASKFYDSGSAPYLDIYSNVAESGKPFHFETYFPQLNKYFNISVFSPEKGWFATIFSDITDRKNAVKALEKSEEKFRLAFQTSPDAININRLSDGKYVEINEGFTAITGYTANDVIDKSSLEINIWGDNLDRTKLIAGLKEHGKVYNLEAKFRKKDGGLIDGLMSAAIITLFNEPHILSISRDISKIKKAQEELRESETKQRLILNSINEIVYSTSQIVPNSLEGNSTFISGRSEIILGIKGADFLQNRGLWFSLIHPDDRSLVGEQTAKIFASKSTGVRNYRILNKLTGKYLWIEDIVVPQIDSEGNIIGTFGVARDITESKLVNEELISAKEKAESASKLKDAFIANISHEIRTPLNGILGMTSLIKDTFQPYIKTEDEELFKGVVTSSKRIVRTIDMILNYSRLQVGEFSISSKNFNISSVCADLVMEFSLLAKYKSLELSFRNNCGEVKWNGDESSITMAVTQLIDNAIKYTQKGFIDVTFRKGNENDIILEIKDTGIGISEKYLENIFEPYRQVQMGYGRAYEGVGLGLSIAKMILKLNGADLTVNSKEGEGSTFIIKFREALQQPDKMIRTEKQSEVIPLHSKSGFKLVLLVEDDMPNQIAITRFIENNYKVLITDSSDEAKKIIKSEKIDLILMDISIKGKQNGLELTKELKADSEYSHIPIIVITAHAFDSDRINSLAAGCDSYLSKPFTKESLLQLMELYTK